MDFQTNEIVPHFEETKNILDELSDYLMLGYEHTKFENSALLQTMKDNQDLFQMVIDKANDRLVDYAKTHSEEETNAYKYGLTMHLQLVRLKFP